MSPPRFRMPWKGSYIIVCRLATARTIAVGKLGDLFFEDGIYAYVGSAMGGLGARIKRHLRKEKKKRWHIDYLLEFSQIIDLVPLESPTRCECEIAANLARHFRPIYGFGSSDCKCKGHLFFVGSDKTTVDNVVRRLYIETPALTQTSPMEVSSGLSGVLLDLDGTLTVPGALNFPEIKEEMGCPQDVPILEFIESRPRSEQLRLNEILERHEAKAAEKSVPNEGSEQFLRSLLKKGYKLGIITRNRNHSVEIVLRKFESIRKQDFSVIITRENAPPKPHPAGVEMAAKGMGITPRELLVVGDYRFDIIAGKAAGAKTALLRNATMAEHTEPKPLADYVVNDLMELLHYL